MGVSSARRIGSLCSGYGGLDLGLMAVIGGSVAWHVEYDKHPSAILDARFPGVPNYGDVTTTDWSQVEPVDWLTAGYPCQPFSHAGKRKGSADERHIWPDVGRAIGALRPRRVLLENVAGHLSLGFDTVLADLATLGYDATWGVVRASDAGAPHRRERLFILAADTQDDGHERRGRTRGRRAGSADSGRSDGHAALRAVEGGDDAGDPRGSGAERLQREARGGRGAASDAPGDTGRVSDGDRGAAADPDLAGREALNGRSGPRDARRLQPVERGGESVEWGPYAAAVVRWECVTGRTAPRPTERGRTGERLSPVFVEWLMGLPAGWVTDVGLSRNVQLKALGNGVVPQQAALAVELLLSVPSSLTAKAG